MVFKPWLPLLAALALLVSAAAQVQFISSPYNADLPEEEPVGTEVITVGAFYLDSFRISRTDGEFSLPSEGDAGFFTVQSVQSLLETSGIIRTAAVFDRDVENPQTMFEFDLTYTIPDGSQSATAQVRVSLVDINDNAPRFTERIFDVPVAEATPGGMAVFNVTAEDPDRTLSFRTINEATETFGELVYTVDNGRIIYSLIAGNELGHFVINSDNGTLSLSSDTVLDVDLIELYNLTVFAVDGGGLNDTATILVHVLDSNDNQPEILSPLAVEVTIPEDTPTGYVLVESINATDADRGLNAEIRFLITDGDVTNSFTIDEVSGEITVSSSLDREVSATLVLTVAARDQGIVPLQDTITVVVILLDINDYAPTFLQESYEATVNENSNVNTSVTRIEAMDLDLGPNGTVTYSILSEANSTFVIDTQTGEIFTNGTLNREEIDSYSFEVEAVDNPENLTYQLSSVVAVTVLIGDVNDNAPIFEQDSYEVNILDTVRRNTEIIQLVANDLDAGPNGDVSYLLIPDSTDTDAFRIEETTGIVSVNEPLRYEDRSEYIYTVRALDSRLSNDVQLKINVHNMNENPPVFEQEEYNDTIFETTRVGYVVLNVTATDPDEGAGPIGEVRYRVLTQFDNAGSFDVNETTGEVFVNSTLDFDFRGTIFFQIEAYDGGRPEPFTDVTNITIVLTGENDEAPTIEFPEGFQILVTEHEPPEIELVVLSLYTIDPDFGSGGEFMFAIADIFDSLSENDSFAINETTGLITSLRAFNRESQPNGIVVAIETTDFGDEPQSQVTNITIMIADINDNAPFFESNVSEVVHEFLPPGAEVLLEYRALDRDTGSNAQLEYEIFAGNEFGRFSIDSQTGGIFTAQVLNKTVEDSYNLTIIAGDQGSPQMYGFGQIFIEVIDANDNVPTFSESLYEVTLLENTTFGTTILQVNASDSDVGTNAVIQYFLAPNSSHSERFAVDSLTGQIYTTDEFDRETDAFLELTVIAVDDGEVPLTLTGSATVLITLGDLNDISPTFNETVYEASVVENELLDTLVASVLANDEDAEEPNNVIRYSLSGNRSEAFRVDPVSGDVFVNGEVDWEEGANFTFVVIATDLGDPPRSAEAEIRIFVEDVNDNFPMFVPESLNLSIPENSEIGTVAGRVETEDLDSNGNSSLVSYSIVMDFTGGRFELDQESGLVTFVRGTLNREVRPSFDLLIQATDHGSPQLSTEATLIITVLDSNDFDPVFDQDLYYSTVLENSPTGTSILTIQATDRDTGANADLMYSILDPSFSPYFNINASTGTISVGENADFFDFENITLVTFQAQVIDSVSEPRNDTTTVEIEIVDSNDHPPVFDQDEYSANLRENLASGTTVLRVNTSDVDTGNNSIVEYSLKPVLGSEDFDIHPDTGVLYTVRYLNREEFLYYNLTIIANNSVALIPLFSEVQAIVNLTDLNDMHPTFDPIITKVSVPENTAVNSTLCSLMPADGDEDLNGTVTYSLQLGNEDGVFGLDPVTGDITLLQELDFESRSLYEFAVMANDSGSPSLGNYTNVLVRVTDSNDNDPYFASPDGYSISVSVNAAVGTVIATLVAFDGDQGLNAELTYTIVADESLGLFSLESTEKGRLRTDSSLFGYDDQNFTLTIQASDPLRSTTVPITIFIQRGDIDLPYFTEQSFSVSIPEDSSGGQSIFDFSSLTENEVQDSYNIVGGNIDNIFRITGMGAVRLESPSLDFETQCLYQLSISIANSAGDVAYTILDIVVTDINEYAPVFVSDSFFAVVSETLPAAVPFFTIIATDRDGSSPANDITYDITSSTSGLFLIDSQTGELSLSREVDFQSGDRSFNLTVTATNEASSSQRSTEASVEIMVLKGNKNQPFFSPVSYDVTLFENETVGLNIVNVSAFDDDIGSQGEITYGMHGDHRYLDFSIDTFSGSIFTNYPLDYERQNLYTLDIIASDGGNPNRFATAAVSVRILDLNDNTPVWEQTQYFAGLIENITVGSTVISVNATDEDQVDQSTDPDTGETIFSIRNGYVTYSITDGDPENQFSINPDTGIVTIASTLDREVFPEYNLTLNATDGPGLFANAYLHIVVHDVNDQIPQFSESPYQVSIPEDAENGTFVIQVTAVDTDLNQNSNFTFELSGGNIDSTFTLNSTSGEIFLETSLNREAIDSFTLVVEARDIGTVPLTGTVDVQITVLDINEFQPVFSAENYTGEVFENKPLGTPILQVSASDMDFEENGTVQFMIISGNETDRFYINSSSGVISVAGSLDFEQQETYAFVVMATDSAPASERLSSEVNVTVVVLDRNDNPPVFSQESYSAAVSESALAGSEVLSVEVSDADSGSNSQIEFLFDFQGDSEAEGNFVIDPQSGMINLTNNVDLDRERTQSYDVIVIAMDQGDSPLQASVPVAIVIADSNDNRPQFTQPFFEGALFENLPAGTPAAVVSATDEDIDENAALEFEITGFIDSEEECNSTCNGAEFCQTVFNQANYAIHPDLPFYITTSSLTGEIFSSQPLDRENISDYVLLVQATDSPLNETQLFSSVCVHVSILDRNDETPLFNQTLYEASISEFTGDGSFVVRVFASDADISTNADITFRLLSETGSFTVHPERGEVFTVGEYDREARDVYNITIAASDGGLEGTAIVMVTILDENDNPPEFSNSLFFASIEENMPPNSAVILLNATDADISENAEITYTVESSVPENHFDINPTTGQLYTLQLLDHENISDYLITVLATDGGVPALSTSTQVNISVQDTNDLAPVFVGTPYVVQVEENSLQSGAIFTVRAVDGDARTNAEIFFALAGVEPEITGVFEMNETSGELFLIQSLNAEASLGYSLTVVASNGPALPEQVSEVTVTVVVLDQNDNQPQFRQEDYVTTIAEDMGNGSVVIQLEAFDLDATDANSQLTFVIIGGFNMSLFMIEATSGVITVEGSLDRESEPIHILEISVFDSGVPVMSSITTVTIILQDFNDNVPVFEQSAYTFTIVENQPEMTSVGEVRAIDIDLQVISYYLLDNITDGSFFGINSTTGELFSAAVLDREAQELYTFIIVATDNGIDIERTATVTVNVTVLDQNDVPPAFLLPLYNVSWLENMTTGTGLLTVEAFDPDLGENGTLEYSITPSNDSTFFSINTTSGEVFLERMLNREEQDFFQFEVAVVDFGSPRLTGSATVELQVLDNNDNIPVLNASEYRATLNEDTPVDSTVAYIGASDDDIDENADIRFSLSDDFDGTFAIGSESGIVVLTKSLDYEFAQSYSFSVIAQDSAQEPLSSSSSVFIEIVDLNDNPPVFDSPFYQVSVPENAILDTPVFFIPATDSDSTSNGELRYRILSGNFEVKFAVDEVAGVISVADYLNREITPAYSLSLQVVDLGSPQFTANAELEITIIDVNDHPPQFDSKTYSILIPELIEIGTTFFTFEPSDLDIGQNANFSYAIISGNSDAAFDIDPLLGRLIVGRNLDFETTPAYSLSVSVTDNGYPIALSDITNLRVLLTDENEHSPLFIQSEYVVDVSQNAVIGAPIGFFIATDADVYSQTQITYSLKNITDDVPFSLDPLSGTLYVRSQLYPTNYTLTLEATDGVYTTQAEIQITVIGEPSVIPQFLSAAYLFPVSEATVINAVIGQLDTTLDPATISSASSAAVDEVFQVSPSGELILIGQLDRETVPAYVFNVQSESETGEIAFAIVTVEVVDHNDIAPVFENTLYDISLSELAPVGTTILTLRAFDRDPPGENSDVEITISEGNEGGVFALEPLTGALTISQTLDSETQNMFTLTANVTNNLASPNPFGTAEIIIEILDENDNNPEFSQMFYQLQIPENTPLGRDVLILEASDSDSGTNSELVFLITNLNIPYSFTINQTSGSVSTNTTFDVGDTAMSYVISAMVADRGNPQPLSDVTTIFVEVTPCNDFGPEFSQPDGFNTEIPDTLPIGGSVLQISATDPDGVMPLPLSYSIQAGDPRRIFEIDPLTGLILLASDIDFQEQSFYNLTVEAVDFGTPPRSSVVTVNISIIDINNHDPEFEQVRYEVSVFENITIGTSILQVFASDPDATSLTYSLTVNAFQNGNQLFALSNSTGELSTAASIDRELDDSLELLVTAIDSGYSIQRSRSVPVIVSILDLNDNPPLFDQPVITIPVLRLLPPGRFVATVTASDADLVGQQLAYTITEDDSGSLFYINSTSGEITTTSRVPEFTSPDVLIATPDAYELTLTAFDGAFVTEGTLRMELAAEGEFCEVGFCTRIRPVDCTFDIFPFIECNPFCVGDYALSPERRICLQFYCLNSTLVPCTTTRTCVLPNEACAGVCPEAMSVCPTSNLCHFVTLSESCDGSGETCLIGQTLVQRADNTRYCISSAVLPTNGLTCIGEGEVYCEALDECSNITAPLLCQACPTGLQVCVDTSECVPDLVQCCGFSAYYCDVLAQCLALGERCELPNIAPVIRSSLIYLESILSFSPSDVLSSSGHVISLLLSNNSSPAVDSQGEEVGIAIVEVSSIPPLYGEWQYALCTDAPADSYSACSNITSMWSPIADVSEMNALILTNSARVRFVRRAVELSGAVWVRAKLWDGNQDGFLSPSRDIVRSSEPHYNSTLPFTSNSAYSESTTLITILVHPLIEPPMFSEQATFQFSSIQEDVVFVQNRDNTVTDLVTSINTPNFAVLPEDTIEGFPSAIIFEQLLEPSVRESYYAQVQRVNPTRRQREAAQGSGQDLGVGVSFSPDEGSGRWQVTLDGDPRTFVYLDSVISTSDQILLLNTSAKLRFLPTDDFCGSTGSSLFIQAWDGFWNESFASMLENGYITTPGTEENASLSQYNLNEPQAVEIDIMCIPDKPIALVNQVQLDPIPYQITHRFERLFTVLVNRELSSLRAEEERFSDFLQLTLQNEVDLRRFYPANVNSTYVSFSVRDDALSFSEVQQLIIEREDSLAELGYAITDVSQDASYSVGSGCNSEGPSRHHGTHVNTLVTRFATDSDGDYLGIAVIGVSSSLQHGVWQYYRGNWSRTETAFNANSSVWINFPADTSETSALLLHGSDRVRFLPRPSFYWQNSSSETAIPPAFRVKIWDNSFQSFDVTPMSEVLLANINTNPFVDTLQSLTNPIGLFSDDVVTIEASRYGCDGIVNSGLVYDACCVCGGNGSSCMGCDSQIGSNAVYDACDLCSGDDATCLGCDFIPFSGVEPGPCEACISDVLITGEAAIEVLYPSSSFVDCNGVCFGTSLLDDCNICSGGDTLHEYNSDIDCAGMCFGDATTDECGDCTGPGTALYFNQNLDCAGVCGGPFAADSCGICQLPDEDGVVAENRDCAGVCFGDAQLDMCGICYDGSTNISANSTVDACGVCDGNNTSCFGCDGTVNSGRTVDRCGTCGGNNCGCFKIDFITPERGPRTGGTEITVYGAGFFLNDSSIPGYSFEPESDNCGAPLRFPSGESISIACRFLTANNEQQLRGFSTPVDQSSIRCITESTVDFPMYIPEFFIQLQVEDGPLSNLVMFYYDDYSVIDVSGIVPQDAEILREATVTFLGENFLNASAAACLVYDLAACGDTFSSAENPLVIPATYHNSSAMSCTMPSVEMPCRVTTRLSLDGQVSGILQTAAIDFQFIYRFTAPEVQSIHFSDDLSSLIIQLDRQAELVSGTSLTCENIFSDESYVLLGGQGANCYWTNDLQEEITVNLPRNATVRVGSPVTFRGGTILTQGQLYSFAVSAMTVYYVDTELNAIPPVTVLNGPSSIPSCGTADFTAIYSLNPGYSSFEYQWSVFVVNSSISGFSNVVQYLNSLSADSASVSLDSSLFLSEVEYYLELHVVNSIGVWSKPVTVLLFKDTTPLLQLTLIGSSVREIFPGEDLSVESHVITLDCSESVGVIEFNWQLFQITDARQLLLTEEDLSSIPTESSDIFIPGEYFTQNTTYILQLTVLADGLNAASMNTTITVLPSSIRAVIHGGNRTVSQNRLMVLDARSSTLNPILPEATYVWSCNVIGSFEPCYNQSEPLPTPIVIPKSDFVTISSSSLEAGRSYNITLTLTQGTQVSYASTVIQIISIRPPLVEILPIAANVLSSRQIRLEGLVYSALPTTTVNWEALRLPGQGYVDLSDPSAVQSQTSYPESQDLLSVNSLDEYSSIPLKASVTRGETSRANLVLQPNILVAGLTYTFQLTAINSEGSGFAQVSVTADRSPHSAVLSVAPQTGTALETEFLLTVSDVIDTTTDTPVLYQFGIVQEPGLDPTSITDASIRWISGIQTGNSLQTILPTGEGEDIFALARVFDRKGGHSDIVGQVMITSNQTVNETFYTTLLENIKSTLESTKDWSVALSHLTSALLELNKNTTIMPQGIRAEALDIFLNIFSTQLPASQTHYDLAASVLALITSGGSDPGDQIRITEALETILNWYRGNAVSAINNPAQVSNQSSGEPSLLLTSNRDFTRNALTRTSAATLLSSWVNVLESPTSAPAFARSFIQNVESVSFILCQEMVLGEAADLIESSLADVYVRKTVPSGAFNVSGILLDFRSSLLESYRSQFCQNENVACSEMCFQGVHYPLDLFADRNMQIATLNNESQLAVLTEIEGSDPQGIELFSNVVSAVISSPSQNQFLEVSNLETSFQVLIPMRRPIPSDGSRALCLSRPVGGTIGFESFEWQLDSINTPQITAIGPVEYFVCEFTHLSEFVIGLLPPPIVTEPPVITSSTVTSSSVSSSSSTSTTTQSVVTETTPPPTTPTEVPASSGSSAIIFVAIIFIVIAIGVVVILLIICIVWRNNRKKKMKVRPGDSTDRPRAREAFAQEERERDKARLTKAGLLTPEESKISMNIIQLLDNGERSQIGSMNILPSIRLRELRHELSDHFDNLKSKPFYFLTRQLCDIEPAAEQQQFVSLVYGDEPNEPVFVREVATINEQSRRHFCICNNAAVFECSNCSSQGYCSEECQRKHWSEQHQRECGRMSERKRRSEILLRRQTSGLSALSPIDERPRMLNIGSPLGGQKALSPTSPTDWKSFLSSTKQSQPVSSWGSESPTRKPPPLLAVKSPQDQQTSPRTTLAHLAQQPSIPAPSQGEVSAVSPHKQFPADGFQSGIKRKLPPLSRVPSNPTPSANIPSFSRPGFSNQTYGSYQSPAQQTLANLQQSPQAPSQPYFTHTLQARVPNYPGMRQLSVQSVTSDDLNLSKPFGSRDVRNEPLLESDEDDYESTESESEMRTPTPSTKPQDTVRSASAQTGSRPPSLAVRKKRGAQSQTSKASSSSSSGSPSRSGSDSETSSSESERTPLRRISRASHGSNSRPVTSDVQRRGVKTREQPTHASVD